MDSPRPLPSQPRIPGRLGRSAVGSVFSFLAALELLRFFSLAPLSRLVSVIACPSVRLAP
ncbi:hypothetical protein ACFPRL_36665 [Pseudoclavibacter helvolus]